MLPKGDNIPQITTEDILSNSRTVVLGLTHEEVLLRQKKFGLNIIHKKKINALTIFSRQIAGDPLILILIVCTFVSFLIGDRVSSYYILATVVLSITMGVFNEYSAEKTVDTLLKHITRNSLVIRDGEKKEVPVHDLVPGDLVILSEGSVVPADLKLIEAKDLEIDESVLTGESAPVRKVLGLEIDAEASMGTSVAAGFGEGVVTGTGRNTQYGKIAQVVTYLKPTTEFQKGLEKFGSLIVKVVIALTLVIFVVNALLGHPILDSVLFALAIAVGITPELLPIIVTISLSHGAGKLAKKHVVAKRLISIENLGNMDVLCSDKTGTLTEGKVNLTDYFSLSGERRLNILINSTVCNTAIQHHKTIGNVIDSAILEYATRHHVDTSGTTLLSVTPFDYNHRAMFGVVLENGHYKLIAKGSPESIISFCRRGEDTAAIHERFVSLSREGFRVIAICEKEVKKNSLNSWDDLFDMNFLGFITFSDVPKRGVKEVLDQLKYLNVNVKIITGDSQEVTEHVCSQVGFKVSKTVHGQLLDNLTRNEAIKLVDEANLFVRVNPEQKLKIIQILQDRGHTVGYLGDGVNDVPSLHCADVGISVNSSCDVAKDTASVVLLRKELEVIAEGITEGRRIFNNTIKYILMSTSSNFGNMFSAAGASFFLPFLPMTPVQILLTNGLYDISQMSIPSDNVDRESLVKPRHWDVNFIKRYMTFFGPISSLFDLLTFGVMLFIFKANETLFQTGWFIESLATEVLVVFIIRTSRTPFFKSRPSKWLFATCLGVVFFATVLPFTPLAASLGLVIPPLLYFLIMVLLVFIYLVLVEFLKTRFLKGYVL
jgi:Mg2+-importing ATPase